MSNQNYKAAGVDVEAGYKAVELMQQYVQQTMIPGVLKPMANFGGLFDIGNGNVLVSGTDGVGTKLKLAFTLNRHETVGIDCVAMCVNDIVCHGAQPLFALDYIATGKVYPEKIAQIVAGVAEGCVQAGCALIGGETAEMPGFYKSDEYDLAGFAVGIVNYDKVIDGSKVRPGDVLIGFGSNGVHSNGFSLVRRLFTCDAVSLNRPVEQLGCSLGEELMKPTRIYVKTVLELINRCRINGIAHITGGGFHENIPRIMPYGCRARIKLGSWPILPVFEILRAANKSLMDELFYTFNMGIGLVLAVPQQSVDVVMQTAAEMGERAYIIGDVIQGEPGVELWA